ncbi:hypothetical protein DKX38_006824 [Salix brachista]|uniref:Uncharacterized protein n=1 Tax=Salix brachista TaxID=2182728 RepID=A0A5N5N397_9ROSI|nr:hypothetical protein DKX38_006824 [Salix brachista]
MGLGGGTARLLFLLTFFTSGIHLILSDTDPSDELVASQESYLSHFLHPLVHSSNSFCVVVQLQHSNPSRDNGKIRPQVGASLMIHAEHPGKESRAPIQGSLHCQY